MKFLLSLSLAVLIVVAHAAPQVPFNAEFDGWKAAFKKSYSSAEEHIARLTIFQQNQFIVEQHNAANHSWTMGLNEFADLTGEEFGVRLGLRPGLRSTQAPQVHTVSGAPVADSVDWRTKNAVTPVKNQGSCGSCWAFSTVVSMEGQVAIKTSKLTSLSEQDLVDCVKNVKLNASDPQSCCSGCKGGLMDYGFKYMIDSQAGGDDTEASYAYTGTDGTCSFKAANVGGTIKSYTDVADEKSLVDAVSNVGPISVGVDANIGWQLYHGGVMDPLPIIGCSSNPKKMDHGVAVVGYGTDKKDYWWVKNSWGATWGEKGYLRLVRGKNACGIGNGASYPTV